MKTSLKNYTFRYLTISLLLIISLWAAIFHTLILDEVYDNVDDGLKNQKIEIIRASYANPSLLKTNDFGLAQFRILPATAESYNESNRFSNEMVFMAYDGEEEPYRILKTGFYGIDNKPYTLEIRTSTVEEGDLIYDLSLSLLVLYALILLSILIINHFGLNKALKPLEKIIKQIEKYRFGRAEKLEKIDTNVYEFEILQNEISTMINRNEKVFDDQKLFIENASHELQTPITIALNKLDAILENGDLDEKNYLKITETKDSLWRIVHLNKTLLMLSKIENQQYNQQENIELVSILKNLLEDFEPIFEANNIKLSIDLDSSFEVMYNKDLARILLSNLIRNAIRHNNQDKILNIKATPYSITIANTSNMQELNSTLIFDRFYKQGYHTESNGLGLSIVDTIIKTQKNIALVYEYKEGLHQFILKK